MIFNNKKRKSLLCVWKDKKLKRSNQAAKHQIVMMIMMTKMTQMIAMITAMTTQMKTKNQIKIKSLIKFLRLIRKNNFF